MTDKPSRNEEEYFAREELERLKKSREATREAEQRAARASHYMKCPKCGADLTTETYHGIEVDRCTECSGVWFDAGEADTLLEKESGVMDIFRSIMRGVS
jgi:hypothetical protein